MTPKESTEGFTGWAILEVFGHRKLGGFVNSTPPEMPGLYRVDVFADGPDAVATQYYNPSALFALTPTTEAMARRLGKACKIRPVAAWELPAPTPPAPKAAADDDEDCPHCNWNPCRCDEDEEERDAEDARDGFLVD